MSFTRVLRDVLYGIDAGHAIRHGLDVPPPTGSRRSRAVTTTGTTGTTATTTDRPSPTEVTAADRSPLAPAAPERPTDGAAAPDTDRPRQPSRPEVRITITVAVR